MTTGPLYLRIGWGRLKAALAVAGQRTAASKRCQAAEDRSEPASSSWISAPNVDNPALGADRRRTNDFNYVNDPHGRQVPFGSHIRRMNPRDTELSRLTDVNIHRLIRRGTTYGPPYDPNAVSEADDEVPRGAYFLFISAKAMATMEFLQREWVNDGNFIGAGSERDPIVGLQEKEAPFTIPREPVRRRIHGIDTFNVLRGGEYFFMPSLSALRWLADL